MSKTLINHLSESYILEDDNNSNKKFTEKVKHWYITILSKIAELTQTVKEKLLGKLNNIRPFDGDKQISKYNAEKIKNIEKEIKELDRVYDYTLAGFSSLSKYVKDMKAVGIDAEDAEESKKHMRDRVMEIDKQINELKEKISRIEREEEEKSKAKSKREEELVTLRKSDIGRLYSNYKKLVVSESKRITKALKQIKETANACIDMVSKSSEKVTFKDKMSGVFKAVGITLKVVVFGIGRVIRATGIFVKTGVLNLKNRTKKEDTK